MSYYLICSLDLCLANCLTNVHLISPFWSWSSLRSYIAFSCHDFSVSFNLEMLHTFLWLWWHWYFVSIQTSYFIDCSSIWACLIFMIQVGNFQQKQHGSDVVPFSAEHIITHVMSMCPMTEDVNFDYLFVCQIPLFYFSFFSFVICKWTVGKHLQSIQVSCSHTYLQPTC